jgi:hypothetical protein
MAAVDRVPKNGRNDFHKYDYVTEADILDAVRSEMAKRLLILVPDAESDAKSEPIGEKGDRLFTLRQRFTVHDGDSGESLSFHMYGQGSDKLDKGCYKATTGAEKYAVLKLFMIPTGDDPEREDKTSKEIPPPAGLEAVKAVIENRRPTPPPPAAAPGPVFPNYGNAKGQPVRGAAQKDLNFYLNGAKRTLADPAKARFHETEGKLIAAIEAELARQEGNG